MDNYVDSYNKQFPFLLVILAGVIIHVELFILMGFCDESERKKHKMLELTLTFFPFCSIGIRYTVIIFSIFFM